MIEIVWNVRSCEFDKHPSDAELLCVAPMTFEAPDWARAPENAISLIQDLFKEHIEYCFDDVYEDGVIVEVIEPEYISGFYEIELEKIISVNARKLKY